MSMSRNQNESQHDWIENALNENSTELVLKWTRGKLNDTGAVAIARALACIQTLQCLVVCGHSIGAEGASALSRALMSNCTLRTLDLDSNHIGNRGALALAIALTHNQSLQTLHLRWNGISVHGSCALAQALEQNCSLRRLTLDGNIVGRVGARAFAHALEKNETLNTLHLLHTGLTPTGLCALAKSLSVNRTLCNLHVDNVDNDHAQRCFQHALKHNFTLTSIALGQFHFDRTNFAANERLLKIDSLCTRNAHLCSRRVSLMRQIVSAYRTALLFRRTPSSLVARMWRDAHMTGRLLIDRSLVISGYDVQSF